LKPDRTSVPGVVDRRENDVDRTTQGDSQRPAVSALSEPLSPPPATPAVGTGRATSPAFDADAAIRTAAKLAIDAGDLQRARALLDLLDARPNTASITSLALVRGKGGTGGVP
jgi:hypothetical protein